jgi:formylglycine-generating enzyme required for sulfatase activity
MEAKCLRCIRNKECPAATMGVYAESGDLDVLPEVGDYFGENDLPELTTVVSECSLYKEMVIEPQMVFVKGGTFQMSDVFGDGNSNEKPVHEVYVDDFYIGKYPVTQKEWEAIMGNNPSHFKGENLPVDFVSWEDVQEFIKRLNAKSGINYRLPTEAEWEYAARSGGKAEKWAGTNNESELKDYAWYYKNSDNEIHPVGQKKPNGLGLYDMSGNVWEWVQDWYDEDYYKNSPKDNPKGPSSGQHRVLRGGSWYDFARYIRTANRFRVYPDFRINIFGFRCVMTK